MDNRIIEKVKKLLALGQSTNQHESQLALTKAQELIMKHRLSLKEIEDYEMEKINIETKRTDFTFTRARWKGRLAQLIADNMGCYCYYNTYRTHRIVFMGKDEDVLICSIMLEYAIDCIEKDTKRMQRRMNRNGESSVGLKDDYALGFIGGLKDKFEEQKEEHQEWGLVLQKDKRVVEEYEKIEFNGKGVSTYVSYSGNAQAYRQGYENGSSFSISDKIAEGDYDESKLIGGM